VNVSDLAPGSEFAGCRVEGVIGRGGMGVVYRARDLSLDRPVAIKLVNDEYSTDADARRRFEREARLTASIDHPNVIPIYAAGEQDGHLYLVMRYVDGTDLQRLLGSRGRLPPPQAAQITDQIGRALDVAHRRGLVHRDIKPANVILSGDHAYLTDFGVTRLVDEHTQSTDTGRWVGTLDYTSPEQLRSEPTGPLADVYSLGCLLYTCLAGSPPFKRGTAAATITAHLHDEPPRISAVAGVPKQFDDVLRRALAKRPDRRYPSAGELGAAALAAAEGRRLRSVRRARPGDPAKGAPVPRPAVLVKPRRAEPAAAEQATVAHGEELTRVRTVVMPARTAPDARELPASSGREPPARNHRAALIATLVALLVALAAVVVITGRGSGRSTGPLTRSEISAAVHRFGADYGHHDLRGLSGLLAPNVMRVDPSTVQRGRTAVLGQYSHQFSTKPVPTGYTVSDLTVDPGWAGRAQAHFTLTVTGGGKLTGEVVFGLQRGRTGRAQIALISTR
jgi:serine/threonine-protein kinase